MKKPDMGLSIEEARLLSMDRKLQVIKLRDSLISIQLLIEMVLRR